MRIQGWSTKAFLLLAVILVTVLLIIATPAYTQCRYRTCCPSYRTCCPNPGVSLDTDKYVYQRGEMVTVNLYNPIGYDFVLKSLHIKRQSGGVLYTKEFPCTVIPGTSWIWSWNQKDNFGNQVPPGRYYLIIKTMCCGTFSASFSVTDPCYRPCKPCCPPRKSWCCSCYQPCWPTYRLGNWPSSTKEKTSPKGPINFSSLGVNELRLKKEILPLDKLAVGDFNGDNKLDLAVTTKLSNQVFVYLGHGNGCFDKTINLHVAGQPESIAVGDIVRHEPEDIIFVLPEKRAIFTFPGRGDGVFGQLSTIPVQSPPTRLAVGDFNNDGFKDLAVGSYHSNFIQILLGEDNGFKQSDYTLHTENPSFMVSGDFNQDESLDLVILSGDKLLMAEGIGDDTFKSPSEIKTLQSGSVQLAKGDFNNDGILDLVVMEETGGSIMIVKGVGEGSFEEGTDIKSGFSLKAIQAGDLNGDGISDMVVIRKDSTQITIFMATVNLK